jgi:hypothetical protein
VVVAAAAEEEEEADGCRWALGLTTDEHIRAQRGVVLVIAGVVLLGGAAWIWTEDQLAENGAVTREAVITSIDDGWCTYEWSGEPRPAGADPGDLCADDAPGR